MRTAAEMLGDTYAISPEGVVTNILTGKVLKHCCEKGKYPVVYLNPRSSPGVRFKASIHRLLAELYVPNPNGYREVNHIDGNKGNFKLSNLEWVTSSENIRHAFTTGLSNRAACVDYRLLPKILSEFISGDTLENLRSRYDIKESSTLRKLLLREAIRIGRKDEFLAAAKSAKKSIVKSRSHVVIATGLNGSTHLYDSMNSAARTLGVNPASIYKAINSGKVYRGYTWSKQC